MSHILERIRCLGADQAPLYQSRLFFFSSDASQEEIENFFLQDVESLFTMYPYITAFRLYLQSEKVYRLDYARAAVLAFGSLQVVSFMDSYGFLRMSLVSPALSPELMWLADNIMDSVESHSERVTQARARLTGVFFPLIRRALSDLRGGETSDE